MYSSTSASDWTCSWTNSTRSFSFSSLVTIEACEMPSDASSLTLLTTSGYLSRLVGLTARRMRIDDKLGRQNAVVGQDLLAQRLVVRQHQAARIAAGVRLPQQLQVADDVLVVEGDAVELFEQVEGDVRLPLFDFLADLAQVVRDAQRPHVVAHARAAW